MKTRAQGVRDLNAALMQLALYLREEPRIERGLLVIHLPRVTLQRAERAWQEARGVLDPRVASRLAVAVLGREGDLWIDPPDARLREIANAIGAQVDVAADATQRTTTKGSLFFFEIAKVLLEAWLRRRGALQVRELTRLAGCSYPTAAGALQELEERGELVRSRDRRVELGGLPRQTLGELVIRGEALRRTQWLVDGSGRPPDPSALLRRLQRAKPGKLAIGGVLAAHHYDPAFDLQGTPRIDVTVWTSQKDAGPSPVLLSRVDPALTLTTSRKADSVMAIHHLARAEPLFERVPEGLPYADPVETLLDLHELHLGPQADAFVRHMRQDSK